MKDKPLVSIVTPCLEPGDRLARCLDSVAAQTYPAVEHIVVDGGSTDGTVELLRSRGVRYVSEPDNGQTDALNKGFALATGDWLGWLNADDVLTPHAIELVIDAVRAAPEAGWAYGDCTMRLGDTVHQWTPPRELTVRMFERGNPIPQPGALVARWALERVGPLDEELHLAMDYDLWLRLFDAGVPYVSVPETLSVFELHEASKSVGMPGSEFLFEESISLLERGWLRAAALTLGRAAAGAARQDSGATDRDRLDTEIRGMLARATTRNGELDAGLVRAAAYAQAAENGLFGRPRSLSYLLRREPWTAAETRRGLAAVVVRSLFGRLRKALRA
ncbi:MAG TPA: glycosyltransferase family 2 protein [Gaiellaceae bacterium]|nr:glycosyltransferase family 2 protein [Gaiellaceae bacterium]